MRILEIPVVNFEGNGNSSLTKDGKRHLDRYRVIAEESLNSEQYKDLLTSLISAINLEEVDTENNFLYLDKSDEDVH